MSDDATAGMRGDAHRRRLLEVAYGRDSTAEDRRRALDELSEAASPGTPSQSTNVSDHHAPDVLESSCVEKEVWDDDLVDRPAAADEVAEEGRSKRRRKAVIGAVAGAAILLAVGAVGLAQSSAPASADPFTRAQGPDDRAVPDWLSGAFVVAELRSGQEGLAARLSGSVRRVDGGPLVGWVFRDTESQTTCLAGSRGIDCAGPGDYTLNGLLVTVIDPADPAEHALRYEFSPDDGFRSRVLDLDRPAEYRQMDPARWPDLVTDCLDDRGFTVAAFPDGEMIPAPVADDRRLELEMAMLHCRARFPVLGRYLSVTPRNDEVPTVWPDTTSDVLG